MTASRSGCITAKKSRTRKDEIVATRFSNRRSRKLAFQPLEERTLMAGDVAVNVNNGTMNLFGDSAANDVQVIQLVGSDGNLVATDFIVIGKNGTTINGSSSRSFGNVTNINVALGSPGGPNNNNDDHFTLGADTTDLKSTTLKLGGALVIDMGDGNNRVDLQGVKIGGETVVNTGKDLDVVLVRGTFGRSFTLNTGNSDDTFQTLNTNVQNNLDINMGTDVSNDTVSLSLTNICYDLKIKTGDSFNDNIGDTVLLDRLNVTHDLSLVTGSGTDNVTVKNCNLLDKVFMDLGAGNDNLSLTSVGIRDAVNIKLGAGDDTIRLSNVQGGPTTIDGGDGRNDRLFRDNSVNMDPPDSLLPGVGVGPELRNFEHVFNS
jgi:hypothetical protein